jgi:hypothetical protein
MCVFIIIQLPCVCILKWKNITSSHRKTFMMEYKRYFSYLQYHKNTSLVLFQILTGVSTFPFVFQWKISDFTQNASYDVWFSSSLTHVYVTKLNNKGETRGRRKQAWKSINVNFVFTDCCQHGTATNETSRLLHDFATLKAKFKIFHFCNFYECFYYFPCKTSHREHKLYGWEESCNIFL